MLIIYSLEGHFSQFEEKFEDIDGAEQQPMSMPIASSSGSTDNPVTESNIVANTGMAVEHNMPQDSPGRIMKIVPSDVNVSINNI